jgi:hypothetical protein
MFAFIDEEDAAVEHVPQLILAAYDYCMAQGYISAKSES